MYEFIKNQWLMRKYTEDNIANCINKGYITQDQANAVMSIGQITL